MKPRFRKFLTGVGFTLPWIVGLSTFTLYPVVASLYFSFCDYSVLQPAIWVGTDNYHRLIQDETFWKSLENTLIYAAVSLPLGLVVALCLALLLNCRVRGTAIFRTIFYLPSIVPVIASSMLWLWILNPTYGLLNGALAPFCHLFGVQPPGWLADPTWAKPALVLMSAWGVGNSMIIYLAGLQDVPEALYESAEIDGANKWQQFWHVTAADDHAGALLQSRHGHHRFASDVYPVVHHDGRHGRPAGAVHVVLHSLSFLKCVHGSAHGLRQRDGVGAFLHHRATDLPGHKVAAEKNQLRAMKRSNASLFIVYGLLLSLSLIFVAPLLWMISTSLKPIEETMKVPMVWIPRAYYATIDGKRMEVTRDDEVSPGMWHVTEYSPDTWRTHAPATAVVPASSIETYIRPRWENYPKALAVMGGESYDVDPSLLPKHPFAENEDSDVSFWTFLGNTLTVCLLSVIGSVLSNALVAYGFARVKWPGRDWFFALTLATMMIPGPVLMVPLYTVFRSLGWVGNAAAALGAGFFWRRV